MNLTVVEPVRRLRSALMAAVLFAFPACASAQYNPFYIEPREVGSRSQRVEMYGFGHYLDGADVDFGGGGRVEFDATGMGGFGIGYNLNSHFNLHVELGFGSQDYNATVNTGTNFVGIYGDTFSQYTKFGLEYTVLKGPVSPFLSAGIGYFYFDTGIPTGPAYLVCWPDYWWWGYYCEYYQETYTETDLLLSASGGLRADLNDWVFFKLFAGALFIDYEDAGIEPLWTAGFTIGGKF